VFNKVLIFNNLMSEVFMRLSKITSEHRNAIVRLVEVGVDSTTINDAYPEYTRQQIAAVRAHVTMGNL
jgi:hypothetical protein